MDPCERRVERFVCPECLGALPATPETGAALLEYGCVYCGASVTREAFDLRRRG